jgi:hypothetical protein
MASSHGWVRRQTTFGFVMEDSHPAARSRNAEIAHVFRWRDEASLVRNGPEERASFCEVSLSRPVCIHKFTFQGLRRQFVVLGGGLQHPVARIYVFECFSVPSALFGAIAPCSTVGKFRAAHDHADKGEPRRGEPGEGRGATAGRFNNTSNSLSAHSFHAAAVLKWYSNPPEKHPKKRPPTKKVPNAVSSIVHAIFRPTKVAGSPAANGAAAPSPSQRLPRRLMRSLIKPEPMSRSEVDAMIQKVAAEPVHRRVDQREFCEHRKRQRRPDVWRSERTEIHRSPRKSP